MGGSLTAGTLGAAAQRSTLPYGRLGPPDENGLRLPQGFSGRVLARSGDLVDGTEYRWHDQPDGGACFGVDDGGFIYVSNSEIGNEEGGVGALRFDERGAVIDAYRILDRTNRNCSGGATPWGTWLSCEEAGPSGRVFECDPTGRRPARLRAGLGKFNHEAVEVMASEQALFLTEDRPDGRLYRFRPTVWPDLGDGRLQAASVGSSGNVQWIDVTVDEPARSDTTTAFNGAEGLASFGSDLFIATKGDRRLWRYDTISSTIEVIHDCETTPNTVLDSVDNLTVDPLTGDLFVAEDGPTNDLAIVSTSEDGLLYLAGFASFTGHEGSEVTGPAISPDRSTMIVSSQRGVDGRGITYAIRGPFRGDVSSPAPMPMPDPPPTTLGRLDERAPSVGLRHATRLGTPEGS